jgi:hypothetical protein
MGLLRKFSITFGERKQSPNYEIRITIPIAIGRNKTEGFPIMQFLGIQQIGRELSGVRFG